MRVNLAALLRIEARRAQRALRRVAAFQQLDFFSKLIQRVRQARPLVGKGFFPRRAQRSGLARLRLALLERVAGRRLFPASRQFLLALRQLFGNGAEFGAFALHLFQLSRQPDVFLINPRLNVLHLQREAAVFAAPVFKIALRRFRLPQGAEACFDFLTPGEKRLHVVALLLKLRLLRLRRA